MPYESEKDIKSYVPEAMEDSNKDSIVSISSQTNADLDATTKDSKEDKKSDNEKEAKEEEERKKLHDPNNLSTNLESLGSWPTENSGWYYDIQKDPERSRLTTVSLHCNKYTEDRGYNWKPIDEKYSDTQGYDIKPLCTAILAEDFNISISNSWTPFGGDAIGELWGKLRPLAPYALEFGKALGEMSSAGKQEKPEEGTWAAELQKIVDWLHNKLTTENGDNIAADYLNRVLVTQGARFTYYGGTDVNFGNLGMKFTIFSDWDENGNFVTVNHKLANLYPYFMGKLIDEQEIKSDFLKEMIKWQKPPAGYMPTSKFLDSNQPGTFKLKFGSYYSLPNLVIVDAQFSFSRQMVKFKGGDIISPKLIISKGESDGKDKSPEASFSENIANGFCPLSCDVSLTFQPATKFTDNMVKALTTGYGMQPEIDRTSKQMAERLVREKRRLNDRYGFLEAKTKDFTYGGKITPLPVVIPTK